MASIHEKAAAFDAMQERVDRQRDRLDTMLSFLNEKGLVEEFNDWEEAHRAS